MSSNVGKFAFWHFYSRQRSECLGDQLTPTKKNQKKTINLLNMRLGTIWLRLALILVHKVRGGRSRAKSAESRYPNEEQNTEFTISILTIITRLSLNQKG